jgi:pimeloyl-ACP methyl ester carboxylesterase
MWILLGALLILAMPLGVGAIACRMGLRRHYRRIAGRAGAIETAMGRIEYLVGGHGAPVLIVHGSGGGFDQGALIAAALLDERWRWIAPSRFGYLGSSVPADADFDRQADAFALLLDHLGIERVAVLALSHGGPSALLFALHHPERVSALVLLSCGVASSEDEDQAAASAKGAALTRVFARDWRYWALSTFARGALMRLMGADAGVVASLTPAQRQMLDRVIDEMNPAAPRLAGVLLDHQAALPNRRIAAIRVPTLILHAVDDGLQRYRNAEFAAAHIPGAKLERFERGGHLLIAAERDAVRSTLQRFLLEHGAGECH